MVFTRKGTALIERDGEQQLIGENQSTYIPLGCKHRLTNPGRMPVELIEVQMVGIRAKYSKDSNWIKSLQKKFYWRVIEEASDVIYHLFVLLVSKKISYADVLKELAKRKNVRRK